MRHQVIITKDPSAGKSRNETKPEAHQRFHKHNAKSTEEESVALPGAQSPRTVPENPSGTANAAPLLDPSARPRTTRWCPVQPPPLPPTTIPDSPNDNDKEPIQR